MTEPREITRQSPLTGRTATLTLAATPAQWAELEAPRETRRNIQVIVPGWTAEQREFFMTGYTGADWAAMFEADENWDVDTAVSLAQPVGWEECPTCEHYHPPGFTGDCRDDSNRWPKED